MPPDRKPAVLLKDNWTAIRNGLKISVRSKLPAHNSNKQVGRKFPVIRIKRTPEPVRSFAVFAYGEVQLAA